MKERFIALFLITAVIVFTSGSTPTNVTGPLLGMKFVLVPSGSFLMGSPENEQHRFEREGPQHQVNLQPFYMMTTEVTQAQWKKVMGSNPSHFKGNKLPIEMVSWNDVQEFIGKLNQIDPGKGYRLPSEAEWEYACRAGSKTAYYSGPEKADLNKIGWYDENSGVGKTHPVGKKEPNAWGLYDLHGNVMEWCEDWYHDDYRGAPTDGSAWMSSPSDTCRVYRGGSWFAFAYNCRSAYRNRGEPGAKDKDLGFRLVKSAE